MAAREKLEATHIQMEAHFAAEERQLLRWADLVFLADEGIALTELMKIARPR